MSLSNLQIYDGHQGPPVPAEHPALHADHHRDHLDHYGPGLHAPAAWLGAVWAEHTKSQVKSSTNGFIRLHQAL